MRSAFTVRRSLYLLLALCCIGTIYFFPFLSSSISWIRSSQFRYENRTPVTLPFRWVLGEGGGLALVKPASAITSFRMDTRFNVDDRGPDFKPDDAGRARMLHGLGIIVSQGTPDEPTYPFTSTGLICSRVGASVRPSDMLLILCFSSDFRYSFQYTGKREHIAEASAISKQIIR